MTGVLCTVYGAQVYLKIKISGLFRIGHIALSDPRLCSTTFYILSSLKENEIKRLTGYSKRENYG